MERAKTKNSSALSILLFSFVLIIGGGLYNTAKAETLPASPLAGQQLAYFVGYHTNAPVYIGPRVHHHRSVRWTGWRYVGRGCRQNCLVDRWSGRVIRCNRVCRR
ncbi:hypothetical protein [Legionella saoudiensis]|uniref:hypothetical protein n=1 Tax=Legionella saoudiensis TaxID=1750561 RepID=UPI0007304AC2|nr:hypothetical protein [Legionella saoudiensis]